MASIKRNIGAAVFWSGVQRYSSLVVTTIVSMILARLLTPEQYGIVAISSVFITFLSVFSTMGIGPAIIQRKDLDQNDYDNIFSFSLIVGVVLSLLFFVASWPISKYYKEEQLVVVCQILSVNLFFSAINMVPNALMSKNKRFKEMAKRTFLLSLIGGIFSVAAAFIGFGIYSLLISPLVNSVGIFLFNRHYYPVNISKKFTLDPVKKIFSYSAYQFAFEFSNFFTHNLDRLIIGKAFSPAELGYYDKAHSLLKLPVSLLTSIISPVLQPFMSDYQNELQRMAEYNNRLARFLSTISFPLSVILFFSGSEIILLFFGQGWERSILSFQILTLILPTQSILTTSGAFWQSSNSTKYLFWIGLFNTSIIVVGYIVSSIIWGTIESVACSFVVTSLIAFFVTYYLMYKMVFRCSYLRFLSELISPLINGFILAFVFLLYNRLHLDMNIFCSLLVKVFMGFLISVFYIQITGRYNLLQLLSSYCHIIKKN